MKEKRTVLCYFLFTFQNVAFKLFIMVVVFELQMVINLSYGDSKKMQFASYGQFVLFTSDSPACPTSQVRLKKRFLSCSDETSWTYSMSMGQLFYRY